MIPTHRAEPRGHNNRINRWWDCNVQKQKSCIPCFWSSCCCVARRTIRSDTLKSRRCWLHLRVVGLYLRALWPWVAVFECHKVLGFIRAGAHCSRLQRCDRWWCGEWVDDGCRNEARWWEMAIICTSKVHIIKLHVYTFKSSNYICNLDVFICSYWLYCKL